MTKKLGIVYLVGAGPGDPGLITVRGRALLRRADVIVYDRLVDQRLLKLGHRTAEQVDAGKAPGAHRLTQEEINALLIARARAGKVVVRLKGGDPFVFGRGGEELAACRSAGVPCIVVPGVTSAVAGPASLGIPLTQRGVAGSFAVITAESRDGEDGARHDFAALSCIDSLVILMGRSSIADWTHQLLRAGKPADTPVACIASATTPAQTNVIAPLSQIADVAARAGLKSPMVAVVGDVVRMAATDELRAVLPLAGRRIVLTAAEDTNRRLAAELAARAALPVSLPLVRIMRAPLDRSWRTALAKLSTYEWIVFTSRHAVLGFCQALHAEGGDARQLAGSRVAAIGPATARALRRRGILPDLVPNIATAAGLADALIGTELVAGTRILHPRSDLASGVLRERLTAAGAHVDDPIAYRTVLMPPDADTDLALTEPCDAIVLCSPSAANNLARRAARVRAEIVATIGSVTAQAARAAGIPVQVVADSPSAAGVVMALEEHWAVAEVAS